MAKLEERYFTEEIDGIKFYKKETADSKYFTHEYIAVLMVGDKEIISAIGISSETLTEEIKTTLIQEINKQKQTIT